MNLWGAGVCYLSNARIPLSENHTHSRASNFNAVWGAEGHFRCI